MKIAASRRLDLNRNGRQSGTALVANPEFTPATAPWLKLLSVKWQAIISICITGENEN